jgi:isopentenyl-diphosphate delta-isomerase
VAAEVPDQQTTPGSGIRRKEEHLRVNLERDVQARGIGAGFDAYRFVHRALPELDLRAVDATTRLWRRRLRAPVLVSCMTGGTPAAARINLTLARVAQELGLAMGLGSGRVLLEHPDLKPTFAVRQVAPDVLLLANLGAVQLNHGYDAAACRRLVDELEADVLVLHLNPLQEALQQGGNTDFAGLTERIHRLCRELEVPVVVKEVGWGLAPDVVLDLLAAGVAAVDVAGAGGTSWSEVERHRLGTHPRAAVAAAFAGWGIPTAEALRAARRAAPDAILVASGGVRDGLDVAKAVALGADLVGMAGPFLRAAATGIDAALELASELIEVLRIAMFCTGAADLAALRTNGRLVCREPAPGL